MRNTSIGMSIVVSGLFFCTGLSADMSRNEAALECNNHAYAALKEQRKRDGVRELMVMTAAAKKFAGRTVKNFEMMQKCEAEPYLPDCKIKSKVEGYKDGFKEYEEELENNIETNMLCSPTMLSKLSTMNRGDKMIGVVVREKVMHILGPEKK